MADEPLMMRTIRDVSTLIVTLTTRRLRWPQQRPSSVIGCGIQLPTILTSPFLLSRSSGDRTWGSRRSSIGSLGRREAVVGRHTWVTRDRVRYEAEWAGGASASSIPVAGTCEAGARISGKRTGAASGYGRRCCRFGRRYNSGCDGRRCRGGRDVAAGEGSVLLVANKVIALP